MRPSGTLSPNAHAALGSALRQDRSHSGGGRCVTCMSTNQAHDMNRDCHLTYDLIVSVMPHEINDGQLNVSSCLGKLIGQ